MLKRFSISLEENLLEIFDKHIRARSYTNRSEAIRDLIRKAFVMSVNAGSEVEYERRHRPIWPELEAVQSTRSCMVRSVVSATTRLKKRPSHSGAAFTTRSTSARRGASGMP